MILRFNVPSNIYFKLKCYVLIVNITFFLQSGQNIGYRFQCKDIWIQIHPSAPEKITEKGQTLNPFKRL